MYKRMAYFTSTTAANSNPPYAPVCTNVRFVTPVSSSNSLLAASSRPSSWSTNPPKAVGGTGGGEGNTRRRELWVSAVRRLQAACQ